MQPVRGVALPHSTASLIFVLVGAFFVAPTIIKATLYFLQRFTNGEVPLLRHLGASRLQQPNQLATVQARYSADVSIHAKAPTPFVCWWM